jgi:hypothetical protein
MAPRAAPPNRRAPGRRVRVPPMPCRRRRSPDAPAEGPRWPAAPRGATLGSGPHRAALVASRPSAASGGPRRVETLLTASALRRPAIGDFDFARQPFVVVWETTRACALACRHCRAEAVPHRDPAELTTDEARRMLDRVREFGRVVVVLSGGDCLERPDVVELVEHGARLGLRMAMTPAATPRATPALLRRL